MGTLFIDRKDIQIKLDGNTLAFYANGAREGSVPILPLKRVIIVGNVILESSVLHKLAQENISVVFLSGRNMRFSGMLHGSLHNNGIIRLKQYEMAQNSSFIIGFSKKLISLKIGSQISFIDELIEKRKDLRVDLIAAKKSLQEIVENIGDNEIDIDSLRGFEGGSSAVYFSAYTKLFAPSLEFKKRTRRPPEDPVNAMLSLCYTLLHFEIVREIEIIGLDPTIGFYHTFEYGRESLACDFIEPFRIAVDKFVWELFRKREFTERDFSKDEDRAGCYLKKDGRAKFYPLYIEWINNVRPTVKESIKDFIRSMTNEENIICE